MLPGAFRMAALIGITISRYRIERKAKTALRGCGEGAGCPVGARLCDTAARRRARERKTGLRGGQRPSAGPVFSALRPLTNRAVTLVRSMSSTEGDGHSLSSAAWIQLSSCSLVHATERR